MKPQKKRQRERYRGSGLLAHGHHNWSDHWFSGPGRSSNSFLDRHYDYDDPTPGRFYFSGIPRPNFEDRILNRIDVQRERGRWTVLLQQQKERAIEESTKALALRAIPDRAHRRGIEAAADLAARYSNRAGGKKVRSWHGARDSTGWPTTLKKREEA